MSTKIYRFVDDVDKAAELGTPGDLVEIGCGLGDVGVHLLNVCVKHDRTLIGIDPFEDCWDDPGIDPTYTKPYPKERCKAVGHSHFLLHQYRSQDESCKEILNRPLLFAHVDGNQSTSEIVLNDIRLVQHAHLIAVDDHDRLQTVKDAVKAFLAESGREIVKNYERWVLIR